MSVNYLTTILFTQSEVSTIEGTSSGSITWSDFNVVNKTINFLRFLNCIESKNSKLPDENKNFRIFVYTNIRNSYAKFHSLVSYVRGQLEIEYDLANDNILDSSATTTTRNVLSNLGLYSTERKVCLWVDGTSVNNAGPNDEKEPINFDSFDRENSILFFTNSIYNFNSNDNYVKTNRLHPYGPQLSNRRKKDYYLNRNKLVCELIRNLTNISNINKVVYIDNSYILSFEGFHNYLSILLDKFAFITSPAVHGDSAKHSDLIDGLSNNLIGYNSAITFSNNTSELTKDAIFNELSTLTRNFSTKSDINDDTKKLRKAMTRVWYNMFDKKLANFNYFFTVPSSLFGDKNIVESIQKNNHVITSSNDMIHTEDNNKVSARCIKAIKDSGPSTNITLERFLINSVKINF